MERRKGSGFRGWFGATFTDMESPGLVEPSTPEPELTSEAPVAWVTREADEAASEWGLTGIEVDINKGTTSDLEWLGLSSSTAARLVQFRTENGPIRSFEQLAASRQLKPHEVLVVRGRIVFGTDDAVIKSPIETENSSRNTGRGRVVDL
jgi:hypothetical protein